MSIGTFLLALALLLIVAALVAIPLFDRKRLALAPPDAREALEAERRSVIQTIRDIDFDHRTHKLDDDEYAVLRTEAVQHGAQLLAQLDHLPHHDTDDDIEVQIAQWRAKDRPSAQ